MSLPELQPTGAQPALFNLPAQACEPAQMANIMQQVSTLVHQMHAVQGATRQVGLLCCGMHVLLVQPQALACPHAMQNT